MLDQLKTYDYRKQVHARPMTRGAYNLMRGWTIPADENPLDGGYLVINNHGTPDEHVSWQPAHIFESGYTEPLGNGSDTYQRRVMAEQQDLDTKIAHLTEFTMSALFATLEQAERERLERQLTAMVEYSGILGERIAAFTTPATDDLTQFLEQTDFAAAEQVASSTVDNQQPLPPGEDDCESCKI